MFKKLIDHYRVKRLSESVFDTPGDGALNGWDHTCKFDLHISMFEALNKQPIITQWSKNFNNPDWVRMQFLKNTMLVKNWANVPDRNFWQSASIFLDNQTPIFWPVALGEAAVQGNTYPFDFCEHAHVQTFVSDVPSNLKSECVHPDVWDWLIVRGWCEPEQRYSTIKATTFTGTSPGLFANYHSGSNEPKKDKNGNGLYVAIPWLSDMLVKMLSDPLLSTEFKLRIAGQAMSEFGSLVWKELEPACKPHLQGLHLEALHAICTAHENDSQAAHLKHSPFLQQPCYQARIIQGADARDPQVRHQDLGILLNLFPPEDLMGLYFLGEKAKLWDSAQSESVMALELPSMH